MKLEWKEGVAGVQVANLLDRGWLFEIGPVWPNVPEIRKLRILINVGSHAPIAEMIGFEENLKKYRGRLC